MLNVPCGLYLIYRAATRLVDPIPVGYTLSFLPFIYAEVRMVILYLACLRLTRATAAHSPILHSYTIGFRVGLLGDAGLMVAFGIGWSLIRVGLPGIGNRKGYRRRWNGPAGVAPAGLQEGRLGP